MSLERFLEEAVVNRKSFVFYDSFYKAMSYLNDKEKIQYIEAICNYSLFDITIDMDLKIEAMFALIKPQIDANIKKRENGQKGGRPRSINLKY
jgi:hypothetical protein|tara:strand:- start:764 stop:1042 length:279 start_codon:yes stop_codon:yes gene_type:complete